MVTSALARPAKAFCTAVASATGMIGVSALERRYWCRLAYASCWIENRVVLGPCDSPPSTATGFAALRVYITPPFRKCRAVVALKLHLVPRTAARPNGFPKQALQSGLRWKRSHVVGAPRARVHALAPPSARPCDLPAPWHWSGASRCVSGQWPAASHLVCAPTPEGNPSHRCIVACYAVTSWWNRAGGLAFPFMPNA